MGHWRDERERARTVRFVERDRQRDRAAKRMADDHRAIELHRPDPVERDSAGGMIRGGFLSAEDRRALTGLARDGLAEHRVARRANAIVLLDQGWSCERVAAALLLDDDTVRNWHRAFERVGVAELKSFGHEGSSSRLSGEQESALSDWVDAHCPRSIREIAAFLKRTFGQSYSRSGLIALLHRLGFDYRKPEAMSRGLDDARQQAFIDQYENLVNTMASSRLTAWAPPGASGTPQRAASALALALSPKRASCSGVGPIQARPADSQASANSACSLRKP